MADDSPGKVQALRAIFSEKNQPLLGVMPPGNKISNRTRKVTGDATEQTVTMKERVINEQRSISFTKVLPRTLKSLSSEAYDDKSLSRIAPTKPVIGPKPSHLARTNLSNSVCGTTKENETQKSASNRTVAETIASFMFTNGFVHRTSDSLIDHNSQTSDSPINHNSQTSDSTIDHNSQTSDSNSKCVGSLSEVNIPLKSQEKNELNDPKIEKLKMDIVCDLVDSDNYVCKPSCNLKRRALPPLDRLGPPPPKPPRPTNLMLPIKYRVPIIQSSVTRQSSHCIPQRQAPPKPSHPCPVRPLAPPPLPPITQSKSHSSLREEIEELYEDTVLMADRTPPLIPEFTEEEELYNDADGLPPPPPPSQPPPLKPPRLSLDVPEEELYQDADEADEEEFYEVMPCDAMADESPVYSNNKKEMEKLRREEEKRTRREQKEKEKREKELEKLKRKFGLNGGEVPIDAGLVKCEARGGRGGDLPVRRGETVLILRMEGNPQGRWLVKNEKGKIGYVELTNIEVDPLSVKSVMTIRRDSVISATDELYCEAKSEEAIYEVTY